MKKKIVIGMIIGLVVSALVFWFVTRPEVTVCRVTFENGTVVTTRIYGENGQIILVEEFVNGETVKVTRRWNNTPVSEYARIAELAGATCR